jgi:hypothetical protein
MYALFHPQACLRVHWRPDWRGIDIADVTHAAGTELRYHELASARLSIVRARHKIPAQDRGERLQLAVATAFEPPLDRPLVDVIEAGNRFAGSRLARRAAPRRDQNSHTSADRRRRAIPGYRDILGRATSRNPPRRAHAYGGTCPSQMSYRHSQPRHSVDQALARPNRQNSEDCRRSCHAHETTLPSDRFKWRAPADRAPHTQRATY